MDLEAISTIADYTAGLGLDAAKDRIKEHLDDKKLRAALTTYIEKQRKYNELSTLAEEIDFQGLVEYITNNLLEDAGTRILDPNKGKRERARESIITSAVEYSKANTDEGRKRVATCVAICLDIIRDFYRSQFSKKDYLLAAEIVDAVIENVSDVVGEIASDAVSDVVAQQALIANNSVDAISSRLNSVKDEILASIDNNGSLFSIGKAVSFAEAGKLLDIQDGINKVLDHISLYHPCMPYYGYGFDKGILVSKPLTEEAKRIFPPKFVLTGAIRFGDQYYNDPRGDPFDYAYRHQLSLVMEVAKAVKLLGDKEDPIQTEVENLAGNMMVIKPPEFPPAFPCSIKVSEKTCFEYVLLRTQEILDDGTYVISNREQEIPLYFEVRINPKKPDKPDFTICVNHGNNKDRLAYVRFMEALSKEHDLHIYVLSAGEDIIAGMINEVKYSTGFSSVADEIDFLERLCVIENHFNITLDIDGDISYQEHETVVQISDLIRNDEVSGSWEETTFKGVMDENFREKLLLMDDELFTFSYVGVSHVNLFGAEFEFKFMRTFKNGRLKDVEKIKRKAEVLDNGDEIKLTFCSGEDKTVIDTLKIPEKITRE